MNTSIKLSKNFRLSEFLKSNIAERLGIDNTPKDPQIVENLERVCITVIQPARDYFNMPAIISSGYRCPALNKELKSSSRSQHILGCAVDFEIPGIDNYELASWIKENVPLFDQLILEFYTGGNTGWVHVSVHPEPYKNRMECLTISGGNIARGLKKL